MLHLKIIWFKPTVLLKKKPKQKLNLLISLGLLLNILVSCATPPDVPACVEITPSKAWCTNTISDKEFYIDDTNKYNSKTYWELRPAMVHLPPDSWAKLKAYIIKMCKQHNQCQGDIAKWERKITIIDKKLPSN